MSDSEAERYLTPYLEAAGEYGAGFGALLWASPKTQRSRFQAIRRLLPQGPCTLLDAGCGRADFLDYLLAQGVKPAEYTGVEAVEPLAHAAMEKYPGSRIIHDDFVRNPLSLFVGAEVIIFSGSLNTMQHATFYRILTYAWQAAGAAVIFNFLCSPMLAGKAYLFWHDRNDVTAFVRGLGGIVELAEPYLDGDCTIAIRKPADA